MTSVMSIKNLIKVTGLLFAMLFLIQCGSDSGSDITEKKPRMYKIDVSAVQTLDTPFALPVGISSDGKIVYGTVYVSGPLGIFPISGFKWTREGGTVLFNDVPGYNNYTTLVTHASDNGKVIIGVVYDLIGSQYIPWVWKEGKGYKIIVTPENANMPKLHSVTPDGKIVLGSYFVGDQSEGNVRLFVWSEENGLVSFDPAGYRFINVVGMADNGKAIIINSYDARFEHRKGTSIFRVEDREDWFRVSDVDFDSIVDIIPPTLELIDNNFYALDFGTTPFWLTAYSKDYSVIGGTVGRDFEGSFLNHPAVWLTSELRLVYLSGLGYDGNVTAVSPDGKWVAFASHFAVGDDYATIWNESFGRKDFYNLLTSADQYYGTKLTDDVSKYTSIITGFSPDNSIIIGSCYSLSVNVPMFGFVIENFDSIVKAH